MSPLNITGTLSGSSLEPGDLLFVLDKNNNFKYCFGAHEKKELISLIDENFHTMGTDMLQSTLKQKLLAPQFQPQMELLKNNCDNEPTDTNKTSGSTTSTSDIAKQIASADRERRLKSYYKSLFHNHPNAVFRVALDGTIKEMNDGVERLFGFPKNYGLGKSFFDFLSANETFKAKAFLHSASTGEGVTFQTFAIHKDLHELAINITLVPVVIDEKVVRIQCIVQDITQVHRANQLVKKQAEIQASVFESLSEGFFTLDENWCYTYVNTVCADFLQRTKDELLHKNIFKCFPHIRNSMFARKCGNVFENGKAENFNEYFPALRKSLNFNIAPIAYGVSVHFTDVTEQLVNQENINKLSMIASKINNGVMLVDEDKNIQWINSIFSEITGFAFNYVVGRRLDSLLPTKNILNKRSFLKLLSKLKLAEPTSEDIHLLTADNREIWLTCNISPVVESDAPNYYIIILTDITTRKEAELSLLSQAEEVFKQNRDLEQFTYIVSHNLRSPVSSALGCADLISSLGKDDRDFDELLKGLNQSIKKLDKVVKDINTILTVRDRAKADIKDVVNLEEKCWEVYNDLKEPFEHANARFEMQIEREHLLQINSAYLYSIIYNLLSNSIKYRSADRILTVKVSASICQHQLQIIVSDNGIGMDLEKVGSKLFKLYSRVNHSKEIPGDGIGLFLVKTQVEALGGSIEVESVPNKGSNFIIKLDC